MLAVALEKAVALALLADGWRVALAGRRADVFEQVTHESCTGEWALLVPADVTDSPSVAALFECAVASFERVDLLFNGAGVGNPLGPFEDWTME